MINELSRFLGTNGYLPHGYCLSWSQPLLLTNVISDVLIFLAYFSMPVTLGYFAWRRQDFPYRSLLWMFSIFIMACGITHLMGAVVLWLPLYRLDAFFKAITALASVATAIMIWPMIPKLLKMSSPEKLKAVNETLQREIEKRKAVEEDLRLAKEAAEAGLQKEQQLMAAIVESSEDAIVGKNLEGIITSWNRAAERILGFTAAEMLGQSILAIIPSGRGYEEDQVMASIKRGEAIKHFETERVRKDGSRIPLSITVSPIQDKEGRVIGASKIARDITEAKLAEARIQELNASLEQKVAERTTELTAANHELEAFAYAVSHDLRAPLRAMSGFSRALVEDYGDLLQGEAKGFLNQIDLASRRMGELIDGILTLSRSTRGELQRSPIDISALATRLLEELTRGEPARAMVWQVEPGLSVVGDARMIEAVMRNLLDNAWKYTSNTEAPVIRVRSGNVDGRDAVCVADNGAGFDMAHTELLFQPFKRLHREDEFPGMGIGLATVQRIVRRHGGDIRAEGRSGHGATFCFTLTDNIAEVVP
ncbi:MAG: PAS domain S-box protein [Ferrovum sp.]|nr:PAS domain S-box protein [Ferrovum sp.]